jgi:hypothetical protein
VTDKGRGRWLGVIFDFLLELVLTHGVKDTPYNLASPTTACFKVKVNKITLALFLGVAGSSNDSGVVSGSPGKSG